MARNAGAGKDFNIMVVGQAGRVGYEALLFAASLARSAPGLAARLYVAEPQPGARWSGDPRMSDEVRGALESLGARVVPFESAVFGDSYPHGNKIEGLAALPAGEPFVFFDSDTLVTGDLAAVPFDFDCPAASMRREGTWPEEELYWPGYTAIWRSLYDRFGLDFESSLDPGQPDEYWQRYLYFNAGWFFGADPAAFGARYTDWAREIRDDPPPELVIQPLDPWLDQVVLPLVIHSFGGGRPGPELDGLDGDVTCHWRVLPLLYARESDRVVEVLEEVTAPNRIKKVLKGHEPFKRMIFQGRGRKVRALFDRNDLPRPERKLRNRIKKEGFWMR
ncbi:hypothetical protein OG2516_15759 [Oceanicola granulosus HTCC2516]|uniref:Uncharacterized protein n=1 Tax=Oceanicola granulosus (strain ATCC BAA-861 / DSM 15982 / KCTC 12143 / HTCC2516) TaxID=314256 RepID=Q2CBW2_OCEGH|nr:hypothetical protein [Oceanicola granulosus]EAR50158.1 hypothetical protein OG2516_15759 [Oceanicola granulosus HTCC2516]